jgi:hypothetical protein
MFKVLAGSCKFLADCMAACMSVDMRGGSQDMAARMDAPYELTFADVEGMGAAARAAAVVMTTGGSFEFERRVLTRLVSVVLTFSSLLQGHMGVRVARRRLLTRLMSVV